MQRQPLAYFNSNNGTSLFFQGCESHIRINHTGNALDDLDKFIEQNKGSFIALALSYDLKNEIEELPSSNRDQTKFPAIIVWIPEAVYEITDQAKTLIEGKISDDALLNDFLTSEGDQSSVKLYARTTKEAYLNNVIHLKEHIQLGDIYEVNYCQEFYAENCEIKNPSALYHRLNEITQAPFSSYIQFDEFNIMSGSPERFLRKNGDSLISQPIKGTKRRGDNAFQDAEFIEELRKDPKERSENIMIVDLVRNDLSKVAQRNTVKVDELCGIYTFETVHQMISTVSCKLKEDTSLSEILRATFPMGSMTGAPKISAMELIDQYEDFNRGIFSGSVGYIRPNGDFDLNVIIRTLIYNHLEKYVSCPVGGAITIQSDPENEYQECQVKIGRILDVLAHV